MAEDGRAAVSPFRGLTLAFRDMGGGSVPAVHKTGQDGDVTAKYPVLGTFPAPAAGARILVSSILQRSNDA